jgi:hypothetical protein
MALVGPEFQVVFDLPPGVYQVTTYSDSMYLGLLILSSHRLLPWPGHLCLMPFDWSTCSFGVVD